MNKMNTQIIYLAELLTGQSSLSVDVCVVYLNGWQQNDAALI